MGERGGEGEILKSLDFSSKHVLSCIKRATCFLRNVAFNGLGPLDFSTMENI